MHSGRKSWRRPALGSLRKFARSGDDAYHLRNFVLCINSHPHWK